MGTSKSYSPPTKAPWPELKTHITKVARESSRSPESTRELVNEYIKTGGGPKKVSSGRGSVGGAAATRTAKNIGSFFTEISNLGFNEALKEHGLNSLIGKPITDVILGLVDFLGGTASKIDDVDARNALSSLMDEVFGTLSTPEELETKVNEILDQDHLEELLHNFYGYYLYEQFCRVFYERLVTRVGQEKADHFMHDIRDFIKSTLRNHMSERDIKNVNWESNEGKKIAQSILQDTLEVFGG